ncbi:17449_t:CDS:2 [Funneliformis geosporum]|nr:17449_t:CDS:2 [Funneliformis geosporum]
MSPNTQQLEGIHDFRFGTTKSDEEIVYGSNYNFTLDIEKLLLNPMTRERAKHIKKTGINRPPRPQNSFILYRRNKTAQLALVGLKSAEKSKIISQMWKNEPEDVKEVFSALSRMAEVNQI